MKQASFTFFLFMLFVLLCKDASAQKDSLRVISYNIHHAGPPSRPGTVDIGAVVRLLKAYPADVIALQEVDVLTRRSGRIDEAKAIAEGLGMYVFFAKAINYDSGAYGVALLSRFPMKDPVMVPLPADTANPGEARVLAAARISLPSGRQVTIACTHLDHRKDPKSRSLQIEAILEFAKGEKDVFILAGDLNATPGSVNIRELDAQFKRSCDPCPPTFPAHLPDRTIDFIYFTKKRGPEVVSHEVIPDADPSDHLAIRAVLRFRKGKK